jgi:hypothetical protein
MCQGQRNLGAIQVFHICPGQRLGRSSSLCMYDIPGMIQFHKRRTIFYAIYIKDSDTYREKSFGEPGDTFDHDTFLYQGLERSSDLRL